MRHTLFGISILSIVLMTACNSKGKEFNFPDGKCKLTLPPDWVEYDDEEEDTYAFFNEKIWTGNLRITPMYVKSTADQLNNDLSKFIETELSENKGAVRFKLGQFDCVHYRKEINQEGEDLTMFYWTIRQGNRLFICSLTINKSKADQPSYKESIDEVQQIIESIQFT